MAVGDVFKLVVEQYSGTSSYRPGLHFEHTLADQTAQQLVTAWRTSVEPAMLLAQSSSVALTGYSVQDKLPGLAATVAVPVTPPVGGGLIEPVLPPQSAIVMSMKTALKSRRSRGRAYWPGATEIQHTDGALAGAGITAWQAFLTAISSTFVGTSPPSAFRLVVFSPEQLEAPRPPPTFIPRPGDVVTPVATLVLDTVIRSQRRRQPGVGL